MDSDSAGGPDGRFRSAHLRRTGQPACAALVSDWWQRHLSCRRGGDRIHGVIARACERLGSRRAILAMSLLCCLHPPGGAAALTAVIGGPAVTAAGWMFPVLPVGINAVILTATGMLFHLLSKHSYPHRAVAMTAVPAVLGGDSILHPEDLDAALADLGETFDIVREDLDLLLERVRVHAARRGADNNVRKLR